MIEAPTDENPITLDNKIPVHVTYFTAWVDAEGNEQGAKDVYGHEQRIKLALEGKFDQIVRGQGSPGARLLRTRCASVQAKNTSFSTFMNSFFGGF